MAENIKVQKTVYKKDQFGKVVNRTFSTFAQPDQLPAERTIEEFFADYENLYYDIPPKGAAQSHEYLIGRSSELVNFEKDTQDIQPLLDEIGQLRNQILDYQQQIIELTGQII
jgi:hypothetical protein